MSLCVRDVMVPRVQLIQATDTAKNAARMMNKFNISSLVVLSEGGIVGIVTQKDLLTRVVANGQDPKKITVKEIMSEPIIVTTPDTPLEDAVQLMFMERIKKLPVMEEEGDMMKLVGILSMYDIARIHPKLIENLKHLTGEDTDTIDSLHFYIR